MALNLLNGQMLNSTLQRDGVALSVVNTANATPLLYLDTANGLIGVNTSTPTTRLTVAGNATAYNISATSNISAINVLGVTINATELIQTANFIATNNANAVNISASGNINAFANIISSNISVSNNVSVAGNTTLTNLSVTGNANILNLFASNFSVSGNSTVSNLSVVGNVNANNVIATQNVVGNVISAISNVNTPNLYASSTAVLPNITGLTNANVTIVADGTGTVNLDNLAITNTTIASISSGNLVTIAGTGAIVIPVGNTVQQPPLPPVGALRFNTDGEQLETWDGAAWVSPYNPGNNPGTITDQQINPDGTSYDYTLNQSSTENNVLVFLNGVLQYPGESYTVADTTISFAQPPAPGDIIDIRFVAYTATVSALENSTGTAWVSVKANSSIFLTTSSTVQAVVTQTGAFHITGRSLQLPTYTVVQASAIPGLQTGEVIYVSNGAAGQPCLAVYDGSSWKRVALGATISAT